MHYSSKDYQMPISPTTTTEMPIKYQQCLKECLQYAKEDQPQPIPTQPPCQILELEFGDEYEYEDLCNPSVHVHGLQMGSKQAVVISATV